MNEVESIQKLASMSDPANESTRQIADVTDWVLRDIRQAVPRQERRDAKLGAAAGCVLAVVAIALALQAWSALGDPMDDVAMQAASVVVNPLTESSTLFSEEIK